MAILSAAQTDALLAAAGAVQPSPRLRLGLILWKDALGRPTASARCAAILHRSDQALVWSAEDPALEGVPTLPIPHGLPPRQPALPEAAARGMALLAVAGTDAGFILPVPHEGGVLFLAIFDFERGPELMERPPTEEAPPLEPVAAPAPETPGPPGLEPDPEPVTAPVPAPASSGVARAGHVVGVRADLGPQRQLLAITMEAAQGWLDTGLDPVQLATRPLLIGFDLRMLWAVDGQTDREPVPHLAFRFVEDGSVVERPHIRYAPSPADPPVAKPGEQLTLDSSPRLRFPDLPGRIEVRIVHVDCDVPVVGYQGYFRIMAMVQRAGPGDLPHKHQLDHIRKAPWEPGFEIPERLPDPVGAPVVSLEDEPG
jgi:hypothetical protein